MSGTRLNISSLSGQPFVSERFGVAPPSFPILDLLFSAFLDVLVLGYTLPVALMHRVDVQHLVRHSTRVEW